MMPVYGSKRVTAIQGFALWLGASHALAKRPLVIVESFTDGAVAMRPIGERAKALLDRITEPSSAWPDGRIYDEGRLLVEGRYANDIVAALRAEGASVP